MTGLDVNRVRKKVLTGAFLRDFSFITSPKASRIFQNGRRTIFVFENNELKK